MKVLVAGATGAIGKPLLDYLVESGHKAFALVRSPRPAGTLTKGTTEVIADALEAASVMRAINEVSPDVIINELTSLAKHYTPGEMQAAAARDAELRVKGNANLLAPHASLIAAVIFCSLPPTGMRPGRG